jgi:hypothetical protein
VSRRVQRQGVERDLQMLRKTFAFEKECASDTRGAQKKMGGGGSRFANSRESVNITCKGEEGGSAQENRTATLTNYSQCIHTRETRVGVAQIRLRHCFTSRVGVETRTTAAYKQRGGGGGGGARSRAAAYATLFKRTQWSPVARWTF